VSETPFSRSLSRERSETHLADECGEGKGPLPGRAFPGQIAALGGREEEEETINSLIRRKHDILGSPERAAAAAAAAAEDEDEGNGGFCADIYAVVRADNVRIFARNGDGEGETLSSSTRRRCLSPLLMLVILLLTLAGLLSRRKYGREVVLAGVDVVVDVVNVVVVCAHCGKFLRHRLSSLLFFRGTSRDEFPEMGARLVDGKKSPTGILAASAKTGPAHKGREGRSYWGESWIKRD